MKTRCQPILAAAIILLAFLQPLRTLGQGTAFTYQGRLIDNGARANGNYDLRFAIFDADSGGTQIGATLTNISVVVSNGLFTLPLDFGSGIFTGSSRWLEVGERVQGADLFSTLSPRQALTAAPYAIAAGSLTGTLPASQVAGILNAGQIPDLDASKITGGILTGDGSGLINIPLSGLRITPLTNHQGNVSLSGIFVGDGSGLTGLNPANLVPGTAAIDITGNAATATTAATVIGNITDAQLSANVALLNGTNNFTGTNQFAGVVLMTNANSQLAGKFIGDGSGLTNLGAAFLTGTLSAGQVSGTLDISQIPDLDASKITSGTFTGDGGGLTGLNPTNLITGTAAINITGNAATATTAATVTGNIMDAQLSVNVALLNGTNNFTGTNQFAGVALMTNANNQVAGTFTGDGGGLTGLNPTNLTAGTAAINISGNAATATAAAAVTGNIPDALLSTNVARLNGPAGFAGNVTALAFSGSGATLTNLNADQLLSGTMPDARLGTNIARLNSSPAFTGSVTAPQFIGNGSSLTNLTAASLSGSIPAGSISDGSISSAKIADGAITSTKLLSGVRTGSVLDAQFSVLINGTAILSAGFSPPFETTPKIFLDNSGWTLITNSASGFTATAPLALSTVDSTGTVGLYTSLAVVNGKPAISYYDIFNQDLKFACASDVQGSSAWTTVTVDSTGDVGIFTSLAVVNGKPAISYYDASNHDLKFAYASDAQGSGAWTTVIVDSTGDVGLYTSLAVVNGKPAISYYDASNHDLKFAYASDAQGSGAWTTVIVDSTGDVGIFTSLAVVNGKPAISYYDASNHDLKFAYASDAQGGGAWTTVIVDSTGDVGLYTSLAVVNGRPAISYYDASNHDLKFAYASDVQGSGAWTTVTVDSIGDVGIFTSLAVVNGKPAISYYDVSKRDLKFACTSDAQGSGAWTTVAVDSAGDAGLYASLAVVNGKPAISYFNSSTGDLKFVTIPLVNWSAEEVYPITATSVASVDATRITGTIADSSLSPNMARLNGPAGFAGNVTAFAFSGSGATLTNLNADQLASGTVPDARLGTNIARLDSSPTFTGSVTAPQFIGNGSSLTSLTAANLSGSIPAGSISDGSISSAKIANGAITSTKFSSGLRTGTAADAQFTGLTNGTAILSVAFTPSFQTSPALWLDNVSWALGSKTTNGFTATAPLALLTVDAAGDVGAFTSLAVVNGKLAIGYYDNSNHDLKFAYASDVQGSGAWTKVTVDSTGEVGQYTSLSIVNGKPAISYYDVSNGDLKFAYASDAQGSGVWATVTVDPTLGVGYYTSLAVVNGKPAISYYDASNAALKFAYASDAQGSGAWTTVTVASGNGGYFTSLAVVNGKPAISYYDTSNHDLKFAYASSAQGSGVWTTVTVDSAGDMGQYTSLAVVNGKPAISYYDATNHDLKFAYASDAQGSGVWTKVTVDSTGDMGQYTSLAVINGKPAVSYYDNSNHDLKFAYSSDVQGSGVWTTATVDSIGTVGGATSLTVVNGKPAISYYDYSNQDLKVATIPSVNWSAEEVFPITAASVASVDATRITGTIANTQLSPNVVKLDDASTISGTKTFTVAPVFSAAGTPFSVQSAGKITNLNADLLDGLDSTAFAPATGSTNYAPISGSPSYASASGSANYVQNQTGSAQAGAFRVSGNGSLGGLAIGTGAASPVDSALDIGGDAHLNRNNIYFRGGATESGSVQTDRFHGVGWYGSGKPFAGVNLDGPVLFGYAGGALASSYPTNSIALQWDSGGTVRVPGTLRAGSETNTTDSPSLPGVIVRRLDSRTKTAGAVIARTDQLTLERDGSNAGLLIRYPASSDHLMVSCTGITKDGASANVYKTLNLATAGTVQLYTDAQRVTHVDITFGLTYHAGGHMTHVVLDRYDDGSDSDYFWMGFITSTYNQ